MSLSQRAKPGQNHAENLSRLDLLLALLLHVLVFTVISILAFLQQQHHDEPLKRIEVMMISAKDLAKLQQQARSLPKAKPVARQKKPKVSKVKPAQKPKPAPKTKPVIKPRPKIKPVAKTLPKAKAKPVPKPKTKPAPKAAARVEDDFDPFAPAESTTDRKRSTAREKREAKTTQPELANVFGQQLSDKEKDRYIAMIQAAVQEHWKVPVSPGDVTDPLVEMRLSSNGQVQSVSIVESSGNASLDATLIRAIRDAAPFQLPARQFEFFRVNRMRFHPLK